MKTNTLWKVILAVMLAMAVIALLDANAAEAQPRVWVDSRMHSLPHRPWRKIHQDFHNSQYEPKIGADFNAEKWGDTLVAGNVDAIVVFAKDMHGYFYYPSKYGPVHPGLSFDLLGEQVKACRKRGIAVYAYYCVTWDHDMADKHRDWLVIKRDGSNYLPKPGQTPGWTALCLAHKDYVDTLAAHAVEFVSQYELDGAWFDMAEPVSHECFCPECKKQIEAEGGDFNDSEVQRAHKNRLFLDFHRRMTELVKKTRPGCQVDYNDIGLSRLSDRVPYLDNIDIEALPTGGWGYFYAPAQIRYQRTFGIPVYGMSGRFVSSWADFGGLKLPVQLDVELASIVANAARCDVGDQMLPTGVLSPAVYHVIGKSFSRIKALEPYLEGAAPVTEAAVMVTDRALDRMRDQSLYGIVKLALESHLQFDCVEPGQPWERYGLIVIPDELRVDDATIKRLQVYVENGGALIVSDQSGLRRGRDETWLDRYGFEYAGPSPFKPAYLVPKYQVKEDMPSYAYALYDGAGQWKVSGPAQTLAVLGEPLFQRSAEHYTSHRQSPFHHETGFAVSACSGHVGLLGFPLGASYYTKGYWIYREMFQKTLDEVLPVRLIETDAPPSTEITVTHQLADAALKRGERYLVHIVNWSPSRGTPQHPTVHEDPVPLHDVHVKLNLPLGRSAVRTVVEPGLLKPDVHARGIEFTVPKVAVHEIVCIDVPPAK